MVGWVDYLVKLDHLTFLEAPNAIIQKRRYSRAAAIFLPHNDR
ncbi:hypothetical protein ANO14919_033270 [Xylariales sp. No.14919]|nr:hypothetical protein ANO14919_033270 [Xylariales sp. No.14919]